MSAKGRASNRIRQVEAVGKMITARVPIGRALRAGALVWAIAYVALELVNFYRRGHNLALLYDYYTVLGSGIMALGVAVASLLNQIRLQRERDDSPA